MAHLWYRIPRVCFLLHRRKTSKLKRRVIRLSIVVIIISGAIFGLFEFKARDLVAITVDNELEIIAQSSMDDAVSEVLREFVTDYNDLVITSSSENEKITSIRTDSKKINLLKAEISRAITEKIKESKVVTVSVPLGAFTGIVLFSSLGPELPVNLNMGGSSTTTIESEFTSSGINQTIHHIYLYVEADVSLTSPIIAYETTVVSCYELCQTVIVGNTPNMYADFYQ
ncbi:MAG: sporulation protein YunB [Ruminococcaceae bacterium]|nr:sporulation protein YunB [Oscillospiraceae bacterium]